MINIKTPADQLMKELFEEEGKALFWLKKRYHGEKGYEKMRDMLLLKSNASMKNEVSDVVEYISPKGNRWMVFECCQFYKKAGHANTRPMAFCYYETYGSVGAYIIVRSPYGGSDHGVLHFTNHFFLRFCQRLGVQMRSRWMVQRFVEVIPGFLLGYNGKDDKGHDRFDVRLPGSIGRGIAFKDAPVIEIRTYLTDPELNKKQLRETEKLREMYEQQTFEPLSVRMGRIARSEDFAEEMEKEIINVAKMTGIDSDLLGKEMSIRIMITRAIAELDYVDVKDISRWKDIGERTKDIDFLGFVSDYPEEGGGKEKARQFYDLISEFGKRSGIKGFDAVKVTDKVLEIWSKTVKMKSDGKAN